MSSDELIAQGKAALEAKKVDKAVESFQAACELLAKENGDLDEKLAYPNYLYGCALLDLAKMESDVIGMSLKGVLPKEDEDKDEGIDDSAIIDKSENPLSKTELEDITEKVIDAMCEDREVSKEKIEEDKADKEDESKPQEAMESDAKEGDAEEGDAEEGDAEEGDAEEGDAEEGDAEEGDAEEGDAEEGDAEEDQKEDGADDEEDVSNLQLAWEVFEVSKNIYSKIDTKEAKLMVCNCLMKLAEVSREKDEFDQSIADFKAALDARKELCEEHERIIAEIHFELAITYFTKGDLENAEASFKECIQVLTNHVSHLKTKMDLPETDEENKKKIQDEIDQVNDIIKDVQQRSEDAAEELKTGNKPTLNQEKPGFTSNSDGPASDINHLVKKKRTVDDEAKENDETALKKQKVDEVTPNGDCKKVDSTLESANCSVVNGH